MGEEIWITLLSVDGEPTLCCNIGPSRGPRPVCRQRGHFLVTQRIFREEPADLSRKSYYCIAIW